MADEPLPGDYPITLYRGDARLWTFAFLEDDGETPVDMSGRTWRAQVRASQAVDAALLASLTIDTADAADGIIVARLPASEAVDLTTAAGYWDLEATLVSDPEDVRTYLAGDVEVVGDGSHA